MFLQSVNLGRWKASRKPANQRWQSDGLAHELAILLSVARPAQITGAMNKIGEPLDRVAERPRSLTERMESPGESMTVIGAIAKDGAEQLMRLVEAPLEAAPTWRDGSNHQPSASFLSS
jgi:hypothetical protein